MDMIRDLTIHYQDVIHRPAWPYKFKIKVSACPNDCAAASARSDLAILGLWRDSIRIDQEAVRAAVAKGLDLERLVIRKCPTEALDWDGEKKILTVNPSDCVHCMNCINMIPTGISVGKEQGAALLVGGKAPVVKGAMIGWVLVPFMKMEPPYTELKDLIDKITDWWADNGKSRERISELIERMGLATFLEAVGLKPLPQMVKAPRSNPYIFWSAEEVEKHG
jgi:sulfite reductase alpha subunit